VGKDGVQVAWMERSGIRGSIPQVPRIPAFGLHPGYKYAHVL